MLDRIPPIQKTLPFTDGDKWPMVSQAQIPLPELPPGQFWPKISIITPSFNQGPYLEKTIRSVLLQGYPNLEYIIIDGASTDQSVEIIKRYEPWLTYWVCEKDRGQSHAINKGFKHATGELLGWLNSDDWYTEGALFKVASAYLEDKSVGAVYGQGHIVDKQGNVTHIPKLVQIDKQSLLDWANGSDFMQPSCLFTKKAWLDCGPLDEGLNYSLDVDMWLKISEKYRFRKIEDLLSMSLTHSDAKTTVMRNAMFADLAVVLMRYGGEFQARKILNRFVERLDRTQNFTIPINKFPFVKNLFKRRRLS
jgi:glycosyltransferase involved in cell wall biosynthesis